MKNSSTFPVFIFLDFSRISSMWDSPFKKGNLFKLNEYEHNLTFLFSATASSLSNSLLRAVSTAFLFMTAANGFSFSMARVFTRGFNLRTRLSTNLLQEFLFALEVTFCRMKMEADTSILSSTRTREKHLIQGQQTDIRIELSLV